MRFAGRAVPFEIDDEIRHRLLNGLDDIALTLAQDDAIAAYESERERPGPVTTALMARRRQTTLPATGSGPEIMAPTLQLLRSWASSSSRSTSSAAPRSTRTAPR